MAGFSLQPDCSGLQAGMLFSELARAGQLSRRRRGEAVYPYVLLCPFVLSAAVSCALTALVGWHAYLIWHAQVAFCFVTVEMQLACAVPC